MFPLTELKLKIYEWKQDIYVFITYKNKNHVNNEDLVKIGLNLNGQYFVVLKAKF